MSGFFHGLFGQVINYLATVEKAIYDNDEDGGDGEDYYDERDVSCFHDNPTEVANGVGAACTI